jgi:hypothetical protein
MGWGPTQDSWLQTERIRDSWNASRPRSTTSEALRTGNKNPMHISVENSQLGKGRRAHRLELRGMVVSDRYQVSTIPSTDDFVWSYGGALNPALPSPSGFLVTGCSDRANYFPTPTELGAAPHVPLLLVISYVLVLKNLEYRCL